MMPEDHITLYEDQITINKACLGKNPEFSVSFPESFLTNYVNTYDRIGCQQFLSDNRDFDRLGNTKQTPDHIQNVMNYFINELKDNEQKIITQVKTSNNKVQFTYKTNGTQ